MDKLAKLCHDVVLLWSKYHGMYLDGVKNTLILALVATVIGCAIGLVCGVLNTIPYTRNDPLPKRFLLKLLRVVIRIYVEVFRGTPLLLQLYIFYFLLPETPQGKAELAGAEARHAFLNRYVTEELAGFLNDNQE